MADNMCGPSNALQNFQKHSTVDRTLQQDRFVSRQSPSQGFRSSPGPSAGLLDPEFEAFQTGKLPLESLTPSFQQFSHTPPQLQQPVPGPAAWAADFQRLNISPSPSQFQQAHQTPIHQGHGASSWHQDFRQQFNVEQRAASQPQMQEGRGTQFSPMMAGGIGMRAGMQPQFMGGQFQQESQQAAEVFDDAAFARAFEEAAKAEEAKETEAQSQAQDLSQATQEVQLDASAEQFMSASPVLESDASIPGQARIGADLIHNPSDSPEPQPEDPDALARTAGQLLDSVRSNTSQKFQNSEFLQLMRQFRDREVQVEGDKIVERSPGRNSAAVNAEETPVATEAIQVQP